MQEMQADSHFMSEEFDIDADSDSYEKITVPDFDGGRNSRFIHDFNSVSDLPLWGSERTHLVQEKRYCLLNV